MFEALVVTLREGMEGALVLAIASAFLERRGQSALRPMLLAGAAAALAASAALAWALTRISYNEELAEGIAMLAGAALVAGLVIWMWKAAPRMKQEIERGLTRATRPGAGALAVFLFAFVMVVREGAETAIFLSAASFGSEALALWVGAGIGLVLAVVFGVLFARGSLKVPLKPFFSFTTAVLVLLALQLVVGGLHELSEAQVLPASRREMAIIGPIVRNELLLFVLTIGLAALWLLRPAALPEAIAGQGPEARLARAARRRESARRRWTGLVALLVMGFLTTAFVRGARAPERPAATPVALQGGVARLPAAALADGHLHFYQVVLGERPLRLFALRVGDQVRTLFDACEICGDKGYVEEGSAVICLNCSSPIARASLGRSGGCNPIPLEHAAVSTPEGPMLEVREADLRAVLPRLEGR